VAEAIDLVARLESGHVAAGLGLAEGVPGAATEATGLR